MAPLQRRQPENDDLDKLVIPCVSEELDPDDYLLARFWTQTLWNDHKKNKVNQGLNVKNLGFMCDEAGNLVSKERLATMTKRAKQLWTTCYHLRMDPPSWTKKTEDVALYFSRNMRLSFPEFAFCENDWKAEAFAVIRYPDWSSDVRGSGTLSRELLLYPSFHSHMYILPGKRPSKGKRKRDDGEKPASKLKKQKVAIALLPPNATIINVDDDSDGVPRSNLVPTSSASPLSLAPISIASSSSQGSEQSTLATRSTEFTSASLAKSSSATGPSASPVLRPSVSKEPAAASNEFAASNEPAMPNEHAVSNELSTFSEPTMSAALNEHGPNVDETSGASESSSRITRQSHRANVLYDF
jgi:hypothetical protein